MATHSSHSEVPLQDWKHESHESSADMNHKSEVQVQVGEQHGPDVAAAHWQPGVKSRFPWIGFGALVTMSVCIAMTIVILATSDDKVAEEWPAYQKWDWIKEAWRRKAQLTPSTALAITNTVTNLALTIAIGNGVAIAWWRKALKGATVTDLHKSWAFSTSVLELLTAGKSFNLIALCALAAKLALVDNVLLQRAAQTQPGFFTQDIQNIQLPIVKELPANFAGTWSADGTTGYLTNAFSDTIYHYFTSSQQIIFDELWKTDNISTRFDTHCTGRCNFPIEGFGVNVTCDEPVYTDYDVTPQSVTQASNFSDSTDESSFNQSTTISTLFSTFFSPRLPGDEEVKYPEPWIEMNVEYADISSNETFTNPDGSSAPSRAQQCQGRLASRTCSIRPALVRYRVFVTNSSTLSISSQDGLTLEQLDTGVVTDGQVSPVEVVSPVYQTDSSSYNNVILSLYNVLYTSFRTSVSLGYLNDTGFTVRPDSGFVGQWWAQSQSVNSFPDSCVMSVLDPSVWLVNQMNNILFRASISAAVDRNITSDTYLVPVAENIVENISASRTTDTVMYSADWPYLGVAIGMMTLCILCVLPTYWGFWELGRKVTLGPMEIASAFQAPALSAPVVAVAGEVDTLLKEVGQREVRYGLVSDGKLAMAEAKETIKLKRGVPIAPTAGDM